MPYTQISPQEVGKKHSLIQWDVNFIDCDINEHRAAVWVARGKTDLRRVEEIEDLHYRH